MICFQCPSCGSTLNAKDELAGRERKCPKCAGRLVVPAVATEIAPLATELPPPPAPPTSPGVAMRSAANAATTVSQDAAASAVAAVAPPSAIPSAEHPTKLCRHFRYLICDRQRVLAYWQNDGQGWQMRVESGFAGASRYGDRLPTEGDFKLIELRISPEDGHRLTGLRVYQLARRWALRQLPRGDDAILKSIVGHSGLLGDHKHAVRQQLTTWLMPEVWHDAKAVVDYLSGPDCHSPGAGD
jgi:uncharacterized protein (DUF4415 family)